MRISADIGVGVRSGPHSGDSTERDAPAQPTAGLPAVIAPHADCPAKEHRSSFRPHPGVIAQLAAHAGDHPGTRARRRADPADGANLYNLATAIAEPTRKNTIRIV